LAADVAAIDALQAQVDQGHQPGYLSPEIVGQMFAMEVLEWERTDIEASVRGDVPVQVVVANPSLAGPGGDIRTILTMERWRGREDGIYVITVVDAENLDLRSPVPGQDIRGEENVSYSGALQGISQRLLALRLSMHIEGGFSFGSEVETIEPEEVSNPPASGLPQELLDESASEVTPGPDGEFETTVTLPDKAPPAPGTSVYVHDRAGAKLAVEAFRLGPLVPLPPLQAAPVPGPTPTSDDATPAPIHMLLRDQTGDRGIYPYADAWIEAMGRGKHHGGYEPGVEGPNPEGDVIAATTIHFAPGYGGEAERVEQLLFPGAQVVPGDEEIPLYVELGRDFTDTHAERIAAYRFVENFGLARQEGFSAERFMTEDVARYYAEDKEARLYGGYTSGHGVRVGLGETEAEFFLHFFQQQDAWTERIRVEEVDGKLKVVEAFLSAVVEG
jgi:hypothetical protein